MSHLNNVVARTSFILSLGLWVINYELKITIYQKNRIKIALSFYGYIIVMKHEIFIILIKNK